MNCEILYVQAGFRKGRGTRDQISIIHWIIEKPREFQNYTYFCFIDHVKAFDSVNHALDFMYWRRKWQSTPVFLPWRIPGTEEPGGLLSMASHRVNMTEATQQQQQQQIPRASLVAQLVKNSPAVQETPVQFLGLEDSLQKG